MRKPLWSLIAASALVFSLAHGESIAVKDSPRAVADAMRLMPMAFEANEGQFADDIRFIARGMGYGAALRDSGPTLRITTLGADEVPRSASVSISFAGSNPDARPAGRDELAHKTNYFIGSDPSRFRTGIASFRAVEYAELYPSIDLLYYGNQTRLEYDLIVRPGGKPSDIRLEFQGARPTIDRAGDLVLRTPAGDLKQLRPVAYQDIEGARKTVAAQYVVAGGKAIKIRVGRYDTTRTLVIDPVLTYSTFLGGKGSDEGTAIAVDGAGNAYVAGATSSTDFPVTGFDTSIGRTNDTDVFVAKLNPTATALVFATFLGGADGYERATSVQVDAGGAVYVAGTASRASPFPTTAGAFQTTPGTYGSSDGFVTKLNPNGSALIYSTYIRTSTPGRMVVDPMGQVYLTGSAVPGFTTTPGAWRVDPGGNFSNPFVLKLNAAGSALVYSTYVTGPYYGSNGSAIAVDSQGSAHIAGSTNCFYFPVVNELQSYLTGPTNGFVTKLNPAGTAALFSTYLGGTGSDRVTSIAVDSGGAIYVAGSTTSTNLPVVNALQSSPGRGFIAKIRSNYSGFAFFTYLGPPNSYESGVNSIAVDRDGFITATGIASSPFPLQDPINSATSGLYVSRLDPSGMSLVYSTFVGNAQTSGDNGGPYVALDSAGNSFVAGSVSDSTFPTTTGVLRRTLVGMDAFALKMTSKQQLTVTISSNVSPAMSGQAVTLSSTASDQGTTLQSGQVTFVSGDVVVGSTSIINGSATITTTTLPVGVRPLRALYRGGGNAGASPPLYFTVNQSASCS